MNEIVTPPAPLTVNGFDNRGGDEVGFGFFYFSDGLRVAYTTIEGVVADATGGWDPITPEHEELAKAKLKELQDAGELPSAKQGE